jgi:hypothetical protein
MVMPRRLKRAGRAEVQELFQLAEAADQTTIPDGMKLPDEIKRREDRLAAIAEAKAKIEARAQERFPARAGRISSQDRGPRSQGSRHGQAAQR